MYRDQVVSTLYVEISARSFMWAQIRIMIQTCLKYSREEITKQDLMRLLDGKVPVEKLDSGR